MLFNGNFFMTGTRCFAAASITSMELWYTDEQARLKIDDQYVLLDEGESQVVRRWAQLAMDTAVEDAQFFVLSSRCNVQESVNLANKLNRAAARRKRAKLTVMPKVPAMAAVSSSV